MMGICFDCLVEVDGTLNTQACMTPVREGMVVRRQLGLRSLNGGEHD
jgi:NADH dehydrogenase/NADH:ubiquinone oxidoreductase subunit G